VVHVDASKTSVAWARENAEVSKLADKPIRWIVDDVRKFVQREVRRGTKYHGIILDPPTYGRGVKGEIWQIEDHLSPLLDDLEKILAEDFSFIMLCAHSNGYTPLALKNLVKDMLRPRAKIKCDHLAEEMVIVENSAADSSNANHSDINGDANGDRLLPSGAMCLTVRK
jgi:23S rRNA (cytosine1962-C5)-methyltransferase